MNNVCMCVETGNLCVPASYFFFGENQQSTRRDISYNIIYILCCCAMYEYLQETLYYNRIKCLSKTQEFIYSKSSTQTLQKHEVVATILSNNSTARLPVHYLLNNQIMRSRLLQITCALVNYRAQNSRPNILNVFNKYKSTSSSKLYLNPLHRHFENAKKRLQV